MIAGAIGLSGLRGCSPGLQERLEGAKLVLHFCQTGRLPRCVLLNHLPVSMFV